MTVVTANRKDRPNDVLTQLETGKELWDTVARRASVDVIPSAAPQRLKAKNQTEGDHMTTPNIQACSFTIQSPNCIVTVVGAYRALLSDEEENGQLRNYLAGVSNHAELLVIMGDFNSPE
ncbi:unnamed protein product, partial [Echinostoma caproni]|uniref:Endo/exonuclease/phosphatase domain-containing protein n=1 Tax=Echinostoma caproni TaxID=27848 RepID=A0A183BFM4_9TREM